MNPVYCRSFGCNRVAEPGTFRCERHAARIAVSADYEAARLDPTTDRDRWDLWDDGGLERPGDDEL